MLTDRQLDTPIYRCACCQGEIYDGEHCYLIADEYYCDGCVMEVIAGEG